MGYNKRGGKRQNAGRLPKYSEPTKTISFRVPESSIEEIKEIVKSYLLQKQNAPTIK
jgi:hypothetical protein